jgi:hypothetical protein
MYLSFTSLSQVVSIAVGDDSIQEIQVLHQKMSLKIYYYEVRNAYANFKEINEELCSLHSLLGTYTMQINL